MFETFRPARSAWIAVLVVLTLAATASAQVRTAFPEKRGFKLTDFPRTVKLADNVYGYEDIRQPGFTTVSLFVVGNDGVLIVDGQGSVGATRKMLGEIAKVTSKPVKWYIVGSDHGDHTAGNSVLPKDITYVVTPFSKAQMKLDAPAMTDDKQVIAVGGIEVQALYLGRAHTGGDLVAYLHTELARRYAGKGQPAADRDVGVGRVRGDDPIRRPEGRALQGDEASVRQPGCVREPRLVELRAQVVVVEHELDAERLVQRGDRPISLGRVRHCVAGDSHPLRCDRPRLLRLQSRHQLLPVHPPESDLTTRRHTPASLNPLPEDWRSPAPQLIDYRPEYRIYCLYRPFFTKKRVESP